MNGHSLPVRRGFTLVEAVVATALVGVVMLGLWGGLHVSGRTSIRAADQADAFAVAHLALRRLQVFADRGLVLEFPLPGSAAAGAVFVDRTGRRWWVGLAPDRRSLRLGSVDGTTTSVLADTDGTTLRFDGFRVVAVTAREARFAFGFASDRPGDTGRPHDLTQTVVLAVEP